MREAFVSQVEKAMQNDTRIVLLTGDLGFGLFESIAEKFPKRFYNTGVAEQNMVALASGLALSGLRPWVYSMPSFLVLRAAEFIRNDVSTPGLPICLVGNGAGFAYGPMGTSHHALEDLSLLKSLPGLQLFMPAHPSDLPEICTHILRRNGPSYLRLHHTLPSDMEKPLEEPPLVSSQTHVIAFGAAHRFVPEGLRKRSQLRIIRSYPLSPEELFTLAQTLYSKADGLFPKILFIEEHATRGGLAESLAYDLMRALSLPFHYRIAGLRPGSDALSGGADLLSRLGGLGEVEILTLWDELESGSKTAL